MNTNILIINILPPPNSTGNQYKEAEPLTDYYPRYAGSVDKWAHPKYAGHTKYTKKTADHDVKVVEGLTENYYCPVNLKKFKWSSPKLFKIRLRTIIFPEQAPQSKRAGSGGAIVRPEKFYRTAIIENTARYHLKAETLPEYFHFELILPEIYHTCVQLNCTRPIKLGTSCNQRSPFTTPLSYKLHKTERML